MTTYNIFRGTTSGGESPTPIATGVATLSFIDTTAVPGTSYYYVVEGVQGGLTSPPSNEVGPLVPSAPGGGLTPVDPSATTAAANLLKLLHAMSTTYSKVLTGQQMGAQYNGNPTFGYLYDIDPLISGFTETDAGGTVVVKPTGKAPAIINYDLSFCMNSNPVGYASQVPTNPNTSGGCPRLPVQSWAYNGTQIYYGAPGSIDGAISQWGAGTLVSLTYHFDNPLTGGTFYDLANQSGMTGSATVNGATSTASVAGSGNLALNSSTITPSTSSSCVSVPTTAFTLTASAGSSVTTVLGCQTATFTASSATNLSVGQTLTGTNITGAVYISKVSGTTVTVTAWNSPSVPGSIGGALSGTYTISGTALIHFTGYSGTGLTGCTIRAGGGVIANSAAVTPAGVGSMTSSFFSDSTSQAYTNFNDMLATVASFCQQIQTIGGAVIWRMFHEPNGDWFWWGQGGGGGGGGTGAPWYAAAWRYVVNYLETVASPAVHNVLYAWGPCKNNGTTTFGNADMTSYPGDSYVDIAGVDCYGENPTDGWIQNAQTAIYTARSWSLSTQKPFAIFEFGWVNPAWSANGTGNATIYNSGSNPSGLWFKYDNADILTAFAASTPGTSHCGPAYFMSWGQQWAIRWQNHLDDFYGSASVWTRSDVVSSGWNS